MILRPAAHVQSTSTRTCSELPLLSAVCGSVSRGQLLGACWLMTSLIQGLERTSPTEKQPVHAGAGLIRAGRAAGVHCGLKCVLFTTCNGMGTLKNKSPTTFSQIILYYLKWGFPQFGF